jgi:tetratricopeptide (TPR) repeat protein
LAYAEFMRGYRLSISGDSVMIEKAAHHLTNAVTRDPTFALGHATLSVACTTRHFEFDPASVWLEKAEFHCRRALEIDAELPEGHLARAFLVWGPSKNFQHLEAIAELKRALALQNNLPHAYNRLGTILAHIGLLDHAREMYERGRPFHPKKAVNPSIVQVYVWGREYEQARAEIQAWRSESPSNKYAIFFAPQPAMMTEDSSSSRSKSLGNSRSALSISSMSTTVPPRSVIVVHPNFDRSWPWAADHFHALSNAKEHGKKVVYTFVPGNLTELIRSFDLLPVLPVLLLLAAVAWLTWRFWPRSHAKPSAAKAGFEGVEYLFPYEFACLCRGRFTFTLVSACTFNSLFFWHDCSSFARVIRLTSSQSLVLIGQGRSTIVSSTLCGV